MTATEMVMCDERRELGDTGLTAAMFARWLALWTATVDDLYAGPVAERAKVQATRIARSIHRRPHTRSGRQPAMIPVGSATSPGIGPESGD